MKIKDILDFLRQADPDAEIVVDGGDHSYRKASISLTTAMKIGGDFYEDRGEPETPERGKRVPVVTLI